MIDREQVHKVANLARLQLDDAEEQQFTSQLNSILDYFEQLSELDTDAVEPMARAIAVSNVTRPDQTAPYPERDAILTCGPDVEGDFFRVPKIVNPE